MTQDERDKAEARAYANENRDYFDSDGVPVEDVYLDGLRSERLRHAGLVEAAKAYREHFGGGGPFGKSLDAALAAYREPSGGGDGK